MKSRGMDVAPSATSVFLLSKSNCASSPIVSANGERAIFVPDFSHAPGGGFRHLRGTGVPAIVIKRQFAALAVDRNQSAEG